jgi:hypothetical protein
LILFCGFLILQWMQGSIAGGARSGGDLHNFSLPGKSFVNLKNQAAVFDKGLDDDFWLKMAKTIAPASLEPAAVSFSETLPWRCPIAANTWYCLCRGKTPLSE